VEHSVERAVITGLGLISCLGRDRAEVSAALREGRTGLVRSPEREALGFHSPITGALRDFDPRRWVSRKERRAMGEPALYAACAALEAMEHAGLERDALKGPDYGVVFGNDSCCGAPYEYGRKTVAEGSTRGLGASAVVECMNSSPNINLSVLLGSQGACWTVSAACASGAHAVGQAWALVATGQQQAVITGGTQELHWAGMAGFDALGTFSPWDGDPAQAVRPFSKDRMGLAPSGGGAALVVESLDHAQRRGAPILAEILAYAFSSDGSHVTSPSGAGAARCVRTALRRAGLGAGEIEYINAHAAGTPVGDRVEAEAILEVFGQGCPPVSSTKGLTGHECWMAGASELAYTLLMCHGGFLAPNVNYAGPEPGLEALDVITTTREQRARTVLSNSFGFGGTNAAIVLRVPEDAP
jgi:3-oxoacyl-[acyl-carrier-protein] synthase-1